MNSAAFSVLPMLGYILGSLIIGYLAIRVQRYVRQRHNVAVALPRPVHETVSSKSPLSFARSTGWVWPRWTLPVLWSRTPAVSFSKSKAAAASVKNLTIELLPTTGLPPPPTSIETPQLVDLNCPPPIPQRVVPTSSERHTAVLSSQRKSPIPLFHHRTHRPHSLIASKNIQHFSRPPSPHAFLATTPPQVRHKRSRSLGGVPIRRLSGGLSGLRNKVDVEMHEFIPGHSRDTSREHLLVDFFSSVSEDESSPESDGNRVRISPAASDIGVMPVSSAFGKVVKPCPMPLVDLGDDSAGLQKSESEDDYWMWFGPSAPSSIRRYDARSPVPSVTGQSPAGGEKFVFPLPLPLPKTENLLFSHSGNEKGKFDSLDSSETLVDIESACPEKLQIIPKLREELLDGGVTVDVIPDLLVNPFDDNYAVDIQSPLSGEQQPSTKLVDVDDHEYEPRVQHFPSSSSPFHHPLEDLVQVDVRPLQISPHKSLLLTESRSRSDLAPIVLDGNAELGSPLLTVPSPTLSPLVPTDASIQFFATESTRVESLELMNWPLSELEDLWGDSSQGQVLVSNLASELAMEEVEHLHPEQEDVRTQDMLTGKEYMETSPGGSLLPTVLDGESADEEVPVLDLDLDDLGITETLITQEQGEEEEDTPRPTPASVNTQLPVLDDVPAIFVGDDSTENNSEDVILQNEACPDPDLLPLPELLLSSSWAIGVSESVECKLTDSGLQPSSQIPTPPASPPSTSPIRLSPASPNPTRAGKSLPASPRSGLKIVAGETTKVGSKSRPTSPYPALDPLPLIEAEEKNGQMTPVPRKPLRAAEPAQKVAVGAMEVMEIDKDDEGAENKQGSSLPGSFSGYSEPSSASTSTSAFTSTTIAARLATSTGPMRFHPSVRAIVNQPVEIALAMQLRPGLGAGADPAWMVRFLMAMFGWFAVLVSGQENY